MSQLQVSEGPSDLRQVRFELKTGLLSGVWVTLQQAQGRIEIDIRGGTGAARVHLSAVVQREVDGMARRCKRDLLVRISVGQEGHEDQDVLESLVEVIGQA